MSSTTTSPKASDAESTEMPTGEPTEKPGGEPTAPAKKTPAKASSVASAKKASSANSQPLVQVTGRRKQAIAQVRFRDGVGQFTVNKRPLEEYFTSASHRAHVLAPLEEADLANRYNIDATVRGGGSAGQAGALRLGIARGVVELDETQRIPLKRRGMLTRDPRKKESKKYGLKKARKAPQYSKR